MVDIGKSILRKLPIFGGSCFPLKINIFERGFVPGKEVDIFQWEKEKYSCYKGVYKVELGIKLSVRCTERNVRNETLSKRDHFHPKLKRLQENQNDIALAQAFFVHPRKNSRGQKLKKLKTQEKKNSKLKPKTQFSGIFQKILQIVYFLKRRYNLS